MQQNAYLVGQIARADIGSPIRKNKYNYIYK